MSDDAIGSITGTATFDWVEVAVSEDYQTVTVHGIYGDSDETVYECSLERLRIGGMKVRQMFDSFQLEPDGDGFIWVEATEDELRITNDKPDNE